MVFGESEQRAEVAGDAVDQLGPGAQRALGLAGAAGDDLVGLLQRVADDEAGVLLVAHRLDDDDDAGIGGVVGDDEARVGHGGGRGLDDLLPHRPGVALVEAAGVDAEADPGRDRVGRCVEQRGGGRGLGEADRGHAEAGERERERGREQTSEGGEARPEGAGPGAVEKRGHDGPSLARPPQLTPNSCARARA